jgi:hypothetical protein
MAAQPPPSSSSRRSRTGDTNVGSFRIEEEIGKGSFATVFRGTHKVSSIYASICELGSTRGGTLVRSLDLAQNHLLFKADYLYRSMLMFMFTGQRSSSSYQIGQPCQAKQEAQGEPLLRDRNPERTTSSTYRCTHRLPRITNMHKLGHGIL